MDVWLVVAYAGIIGTVVTAAAVRREPTALRGRSLFILTATTTMLWAVFLLVNQRRPSAISSVLVAGALVVTFLLRSRWLVVRATPAVVDESITGSARRLLLVCEGVPGARRIVCSALVLDVHSTPFGWVGTQVKLSHLPRHKKLDLFRSLLGKQYKGAMPLPTFRL